LSAGRGEELVVSASADVELMVIDMYGVINNLHGVIGGVQDEELGKRTIGVFRAEMDYLIVKSCVGTATAEHYDLAHTCARAPPMIPSIFSK